MNGWRLCFVNTLRSFVFLILALSVIATFAACGGVLGAQGSTGRTGSEASSVPSTSTYLYLGHQWADRQHFTPSPIPDIISEYTISPTTSELTKIGAVLSNDPNRFTGAIGSLQQAGPWLFVNGNGAGLLYRINDDGTLTQRAPQLGPDATMLVADPSGNWVALNQDLREGPFQTLYRVNSDGSLTDPRPVPFGCRLIPQHEGFVFRGSFFDPSGKLLLTPIDILGRIPGAPSAGSCNGVYNFDAVTGTFSPHQSSRPNGAK